MLSEEKNGKIRSFTPYHHINTDNQKACGGTSIFVKNTILHRKLNLNTNLQAIAVRATLDRPTSICSLYLPPNSNPTLKEIENLIRQLPSPFILVGDFNAHSPLWGGTTTNPKGKIIEDLLLKNNLCIFNDKTQTYENLNAQIKSAIDLSICDPILFQNFSWSVLDDLHGSDHHPITLTSIKPPKNSFPQKWNFKKADWTSFAADCKKQLNLQSANQNYNSFFNILTEICLKHIPKTSPKPRKNKSWFTEECRQAIARKKRAYRLFVKTKSEQSLKEYKICRAQARRILRQSKRETFKKYISKINNRTPMSKVWQMIKKLRGSTGSPIQHVFNNDGSISETDHSISNTLAETISKNSSSENYTKNFQNHKNKTESKCIDFSSFEEKDYNLPFTLSELKLCINDLSNSAPGPDQIHNLILKHLPEETILLLLNIFNDIYTKQEFPTSWHDATIIPIPKPGKDHSNPSNYRPIALTNCFCKLMEKLVNVRLSWFLENVEGLSNFQCGFRKGRSTTDHLVRLEKLIREAFLQKEHLVAVFFDLEKAFDTTWKHGILNDLYNLGLRGHLPIFIKNFLSDRHFQVKVGSSLSDPYDQEEGVPQGSILSPLLFEIKINSIVNTLRDNTDCSLYVDDFVICYKSKAKIDTIERQLQLQLNKLESWADQNGFKFSPTKTTAVHFCCGRKCVREPDLYLYKTKIPVKDKVRFLGLIFDKKLTFLPHIKDLKLRCQNALNAMKVFSNPEWGGTSDVLLNLYRSLIRSKLDYGCFIYGSARKSYIKLLDPIHHQGLRLALGAFRTSPVESLYAEANEPPLNLRRKRLGLQYAVKLMSDHKNPAFETVFEMPPNSEMLYEQSNKIPPFGVRIKKELNDLELNPDNVLPSRLPKSPPWTLSQSQIDLRLTNLNKSKTSESTYKDAFRDLLLAYPGHQEIYTDGSKDKTLVGCAAFSDKSTITKRLNECSSIFSAEAEALMMALEIADTSAENKFIILTDSLSCLEAIKNFKTGDIRILNLIEKIDSLSQRKTVVFAWVPGHVGVPGNERADALAKESLHLAYPEHTKALYMDHKFYIRKAINNIFNNQWSSLNSNKLQEIIPEISPRKSVNLPRKIETLLTRLRIGHTPFTHNFILLGEPPPHCVGCDQAVTVKHILTECIDFENSRKKFFRTRSLKMLFDIVESTKIVEFLREIGLLGHL